MIPSTKQNYGSNVKTNTGIKKPNQINENDINQIPNETEDKHKVTTRLETY